MVSPRDLSLQKKLAVAFASIIVIFLGVCWSVMGNIAVMTNASEDKERSLLAKQVTEQLIGDVLEQQNAARAYAILGRAKFRTNYDKAGSAFSEHVARFSTLTNVAAQKERAGRLVAAQEVVRGKLDRVMALAANPATRGQAAELAGESMLGDIRAIIGEMQQAQDARVKLRMANEDQARADANRMMWIGMLVALGSAGLMWWLLMRAIAVPVRSMTTVMDRLAAGDHRVEVPDTDRGDEIGAMAKAVLVFREAAVEKERVEAEKRVADAEQQKVVETLESSLKRLAEGDLTSTIGVPFAASYQSVKDNFNAAVESLRTLIGTVMDSASAIRTGSTEIAQASEDLARRTEANAASLEETSAAITQIDGRLKAGATAASRTVKRADDAISTVSTGRQIADEAVQAMTRVSESAKGIDSVIEGLDKIAFQTRVLAMNAAVEAGRAGEAGRGFAVVADLVSALAMRSEEEASRAREQLTATQSDVVSAVEMVQKVDAALVDISGDVTEVHQLLADMAADNQAQSTAITQISVAVGTMDQTTQQNAAMVEETAAAARNLTGEVATLADQAARFNVGGRAPGRVESALAPASRPARPAKDAYVSPVSALPSSAPAPQDWASF